VSRPDGGCAPLPGAHVELWQCDATGAYSGVRDGSSDTAAQKFLRGYQVTDAAGTARFTTIYPGAYSGRTVHIHFMILAAGASGRREQFTSQLYFDDALTDRILAQPPYKGRSPDSPRNAGDGLYRSGGSQLLLAVKEQGRGLAASFDIGLQRA
jgi:protocatechuate 3,4-dioxygenase beta subunit